MKNSLSNISLVDVLTEARNCQLCRDSLPYEPNPVVRAAPSARLLIVGQAPGLKVHNSGIPWDDASGDRLRHWLQLDKEAFYNETDIAIIPMAFCYPGRGKSGDLPPPKVCAPQWHSRLLAQLPELRLTLLIGQYAQQYYLNDRFKTLTERVRHWREAGPALLPLVHPSPRNQYWLQQNPWFESELLLDLRARVKLALK